MRVQINRRICLLLGVIAVAAEAAIPQPNELEKLLMDGNYDEFEKITRVPVHISKYVEVADFPTALDLNSQPLHMGDLLLLPEQFDEVDGEQVANGLLVGGKWSKEIPYAILNVNYTKEEMSTIEESIQSYNSHFVGVLEWRRQTASDEDYIAIFNGNGCFSHLGKLGGIQAISLRPGLDFQPCLSKGWTHHEMTHSLGIEHMNSRLDRDVNIRNHPDKFPKGLEMLYGTILPNASTMDTSKQYFQITGPYRYDSLMHLSNSLGPYEGPFFDVLWPSDMAIPIEDLGVTEKLDLTPLDVQMITNLFVDLNKNPVTPPPAPPSSFFGRIWSFFFG